MRIVELRRRRPDAEVERLARVYVIESGGPAYLEVYDPENQEGIETLIADGATGLDGRWRELADGEAFLAALPVFYRGSRFWAQELEGDDLS